VAQQFSTAVENSGAGWPPGKTTAVYVVVGVTLGDRSGILMAVPSNGGFWPRLWCIALLILPWAFRVS